VVSLLRVTQGTHNALLGLEEIKKDELEAFRRKYQALAKSARNEILMGLKDTDTPDAELV